jgi:hypothetical protein
VTELQELSQEGLARIVDTVNGLSVADWVLIAAAFGILYWLWGALRSITRVGPVEVQLLECDDGTDAKVHGLTALLRERLANSGLPAPPSVPAGTPQTDLVSAVAASPIPQAAWIASILGLLRAPQPRQYELSGTIFGADETSGCGVSFWLRPSRGPALLETVDERTHKAAVESAASKIYIHISKDAVRAFPVWTRWHSEEALRKYDAGSRQAEAKQLNSALASLSAVATKEPNNALAQLQLANLCEQMADKDEEKAAVLQRYLDIAVEWPWLVQARYRVSVVAAGLSDSVRDASPAQQSIVGPLPADSVKAASPYHWLMELSSRESEAVRQLLRPWFTLLRQGRMRSQFEPRGSERRELKRTVNTSKHCLRVRQAPDQTGWLTRLRIGYSRLVVRAWHLSVLRGQVSWQTHYIAACFYALLLAREHSGGARGRLHESAFSHLNKAVDEAGSQLSPTWIRCGGDPDLASLRRSDDPDWEHVERRLGQTGSEPTDESRDMLRSYKQRLPNRYPDRPWGRPGWRAAFWLILTLAAMALIILLFVLHTSNWATGAAAVTVLLTLSRLYNADREVRLLAGDRMLRGRAPRRASN